MSHEKKQKTPTFALNPGFLNGDSYNGLTYSLYKWVGFHPLYNPTNQAFFEVANGNPDDPMGVFSKQPLETWGVVEIWEAMMANQFLSFPRLPVPYRFGTKGSIVT